MAESDLVEKLSEEEKIIQNEIPNSESPQTETQIFNKIITDFSDFLSKRSVYEAAPENSKVLVFNSDLSFKEMIKAFINEDIYCALIYDSKKEYFSGIITISDILYLFQYIIKKTQEINITDYEQFIKDIFNRNKLLMNDEEEEKNENIIFKNKNFDILKYLTKINYNDYYEMIKKYNKIHIIYSISLDTSLLDVLKVIYKIGVHRLVVEETKKKGLNENKKKENEINLQNNTFDTKLEKEKNENINKTELEKGEKEKSDKKIKKVKTKKKVITEEENKENKEKEGEKVIKKKVKKIKKKKTENDLDEKDKEENDNNKEEGEKPVKKKVKKIKKKKTENDLIDKEKEKDNEEKKEINNLQKSEKSVMEISNKDVLKLNVEEKSNNNLEIPSETQNFTGFVTYETVFDFLIYNYYSMEMKEFDLSLEELRKIPSNSSFIIPINTFSLMTEKVHSSFSKNITSKSDILPILTNDKKDIFGFLFLRDYLYFVSNCESNQDLTNEEFLNNMYEGIDSEKPLGKERIIYLEYNDITKKYKIKELLEKINGAPEKKIVLKYKEDENNLFFIISLKSIFDVIVKMNNN
jgi:hypothetical protein